MPRFSVLLNREEMNQPNFSGENENIDFCKKCWRGLSADDVSEQEGIDIALVEASMEEEDMESGSEHPDYADEDYRCSCCNKVLESKDN